MFDLNVLEYHLSKENSTLFVHPLVKGIFYKHPQFFASMTYFLLQFALIFFVGHRILSDSAGIVHLCQQTFFFLSGLEAVVEDS